jgi:rare lipoprotein A
LRLSLPLLVGLAAAAVLLVAAVAAMRLGPPADTSSASPLAPTVSTSTASGSPAPTGSDRPVDRAGRSGIRSAPSPSTSGSPAAGRSQPPGGGTVTGTGSCKASFYSTGQRTANGETFDPNGFTAAHKTLAFNTRLRVTNTANGKSVVVRINDRGPFVPGRCLDLARAAFTAIASVSSGVANVRYEVLG